MFLGFHTVQTRHSKYGGSLGRSSTHRRMVNRSVSACDSSKISSTSCDVASMNVPRLRRRRRARKHRLHGPRVIIESKVGQLGRRRQVPIGREHPVQVVIDRHDLRLVIDRLKPDPPAVE